MAAMRESEQYYGARRRSLQGKKFKVACYVTYGRMACGTLIHIRGWQGRKGEFVLGDICLVRGANVLF